MNVQAPPAPPTEPELHLLPGWEDEGRGKRWTEAAVGSAIVHVVLVLGAFAIAHYLPPPSPPKPEDTVDVRKAVTLLTPRDILTQLEPNKTKVAKEIRLENLIAKPDVRPTPKLSSPPPSAMGRSAPAPPPQPVIEAPQVKVAQAPPPSLGTAATPPPPAPPPPPKAAEEKPKLAFETPGVYTGRATGTGRIDVPKSGVQEAIRNAARPGPGDLTVGDSGADIDGGMGQLPGRAGSQGRQSSTLELQSDPMGVDFKPYLTQVITAVRRNWFAVWPESARMGLRGRAVLLFSIDKAGSVPKLIIETPSGTQALDRAAVAAISASNPFPPLPALFRGDVIRLRLVFYYNLPSR
ncbi:MAG: TonB family protein [Acidobacteria bacterium]|nr:TonB family protein [Acidobacteriota bacterium]